MIKRCGVMSIVFTFCLLWAANVHGQGLLAFPGAVGAGRLSVGGRGGDVYYVTNLNDSGVGSLRHGIESASGPRTIVFDVAGVIYLQSRLWVNDKSNLTIAGQTAPGEGITLANRSFFIRHSNNIIVQNMRSAAGDGLTKPGTEDLPGHLPDGNPRSIRVWNSSNVIVDHFTARWGQEDCMGISHGSNHVTIQNSFAAEGLHHADHHKGERGYAMIINGRHLSFMGNLLTQNRSRNPRAGLDDTLFEWHNNMMYHARNALLAPTDNLSINAIGNIAMRGPSTDGPSHMIDFGHSQPQVYSHDNFYSRTMGPVALDGASATIVGSPTQVSTPLAINSDYQPISRRQAYINILSRGGASLRRDVHDRRAVRDVMQRGGFHIDRPDDVGGYGEPDPGEPPVSTARDGIPDWWKVQMGLNPQQAYHQVYAPDGYTYLEKYLHYLTEQMFPPDETQTIVITTARGGGADAQVSENNGSSGGSGTGMAINARYNDNHRNEYILLRFDLSDMVAARSMNDAALELTAWRDMGNRQLRVYGVMPDRPRQDWDEATVEFATAPALEFDGDSRSRGLLEEQVIMLGDFWTENENAGETVTFDHPNLAVFLNILDSYPDQEYPGHATLLIERVTVSNGQSRFASKEATQVEGGNPGDYPAGTFAPRLVLEGLAPDTDCPPPDSFMLMLN